ncbi:MAG: hypothetical protein ACRD5L_02025, partial [Bryobacteraceae bacterium]
MYDQIAGRLNLAIACRLLHHVKHAIDRSRRRGVDVSGLPDIDWPAIRDRHQELIDHAIPEEAENALQVCALHHFAAFLLIDSQIGDLFGHG